MQHSSYDVVVLGVGSAGSRAARIAHDGGARVLAVDGAEELGGLCILRGCMPTKTLLETAHRMHEARDARRFGFSTSEPVLDFAAQMERTRSLVARFQRAKVGSLENGGYELIRAPGRFLDPHTLDVGGERVHAEVVVVATGSTVSPFPVPVPDGVRVLESDDMFRLEEPPRSALVVGAGAVGLEFAQWLARMGSAVTFSNRSPLLRRTDLELGRELAAALALEMELRVPSNIAELRALPDGRARVTLDGPDGAHVVEVDWILNATGRTPALGGLGLENAGLALASRLPSVSETLQTEVPHVLLAGDASGRSMILHEANLEGALAGRNALRLVGRLDGPLEEWDRSVPHVEVIFSDPVFASVGESAVALADRTPAALSATKRFPEQGRGIVMGARHGFLRLWADGATGAILGCQILGPRADDLIHVPATVMAFRGTAADMLRLPWYHPTLSEAFVEVARELAARVPSA